MNITTEPYLQTKLVLFLVKGTHSVTQAGLELGDMPTSASCLLELKVTATTPSFSIGSFNFFNFVAFQ